MADKKQNLRELTATDRQQLAKQRNFAELCLSPVTPNAKFETSLADLDLIQLGLDSGHITNTIDVQSLGIPFGDLIVKQHPGFDWWMVEDDLGRAFCIRYRHTDLLIFPLTIISKRIEAGEAVDTRTLYQQLCQQLLTITAQLDSPSSH